MNSVFCVCTALCLRVVCLVCNALLIPNRQRFTGETARAFQAHRDFGIHVAISWCRDQSQTHSPPQLLTIPNNFFARGLAGVRWVLGRSPFQNGDDILDDIVHAFDRR